MGSEKIEVDRAMDDTNKSVHVVERSRAFTSPTVLKGGHDRNTYRATSGDTVALALMCHTEGKLHMAVGGPPDRRLLPTRVLIDDYHNPGDQWPELYSDAMRVRAIEVIGADIEVLTSDELARVMRDDVKNRSPVFLHHDRHNVCVVAYIVFFTWMGDALPPLGVDRGAWVDMDRLESTKFTQGHKDVASVVMAFEAMKCRGMIPKHFQKRFDASIATVAARIVNQE